MYKLEEISDEELIELCNDVYDWDTSKDGTINKEGSMRKFLKENKSDYKYVYYLKDMILFEAGKRFTKTARMLIRNRPTWFIK
jgi:hypothetical protein